MAVAIKCGSVAIMGTPVSSGNMGVQALGASLVNLCVNAAPGASVKFLTGHSKPTEVAFRTSDGAMLVPVVNVRLAPGSAPREHLFLIVLLALLYRLLPFRAARSFIVRSSPWIRTIVESDFVGDIRGGDSFSDIYGMRRYLLGFLTVWTVLLVKRSIVLFPQTYGPYKSTIARWLARFIIRRASVVVARDVESQQVARSLARPGQQVMLSPDVAFSLEPVVPEQIAFLPPRSSSASGVLGINVNGLMFNGGYTRGNMFGLKLDYPDFLHNLIPALLKVHPGEIWLIPHTFAPEGDVESDNEACLNVYKKLPADLQSRVHVVTSHHDQHEIKGVIGKCGFFVGSRMHSCIAALSQGIPCVGVAYSRKFDGVFESVGVRDWVVDGRSIDGRSAVNRIVELYQQQVQVRESLGRNAARARAALIGVFKQIVADAAA